MSDNKDVFGGFAPAYTISNEDQRWATSALPNASRVLTVAGSGDQALFYHLNGAKQIDTFDKTSNARVIQDIKFTAIKNLSQTEYFNLVIDLFYTPNIKEIPAMKKLMPQLPAETVQIINAPNNKYIFGAGLDATQYPHNIPTINEYARLKKSLKKPFNFICCDLYDLGTQISGTYDLINISNIFDYCYDAQTQCVILHQLAAHLNIGGHVVYLPQATNYAYDGLRVSGKNCAIQYSKTLQNDKSRMILFQRTR